MYLMLYISIHVPSIVTEVQNINSVVVYLYTCTWKHSASAHFENLNRPKNTSKKDMFLCIFEVRLLSSMQPPRVKRLRRLPTLSKNTKNWKIGSGNCSYLQMTHLSFEEDQQKKGVFIWRLLWCRSKVIRYRLRLGLRCCRRSPQGSSTLPLPSFLPVVSYPYVFRAGSAFQENKSNWTSTTKG